jgi:ubiquitin
MNYEARVQAMVTFYGEYKKLPMPKKKAQRKYLEKEKYMQVKYISTYIFLNG